MAKELAVQNAKLPAHLQGAVDATEEFAGGVQSGFPIISIRGRVWRVKISGEEQPYTDENDDAVSSVELVLLRSNPKPSKIHYDKKYEEGDDGKPRCFSSDGIKPAAEVENPIHPTCAACPMNQWGSRITENGKKSRACSDVRRMAVVFANDLVKSLADKSHEVTTMLLRVPPASLNPLKDYVTDTLGPKGVQPYMVVTRVGFDNDADYPKLTFKPARFLSEPEYNAVLKLRNGDDAAAILQQASEYASGGTNAGDESEGAPAQAASAEAKPTPPEVSKGKKSTTKKAPKKRDATAAEAEATAAKATKQAVPDDDDDAAPLTFDNDEESVAQDPPSTEETSEENEDDFDAMLKNILGE